MISGINTNQPVDFSGVSSAPGEAGESREIKYCEACAQSFLRVIGSMNRYCRSCHSHPHKLVSKRSQGNKCGLT